MNIPEIANRLVLDPLLLDNYVRLLDLLNLPVHVTHDLKRRFHLPNRSSYELVTDALLSWQSCQSGASVDVLQKLLESEFPFVAEQLNDLRATSKNSLPTNTTDHPLSLGIPKLVPKKIYGRKTELNEIMNWFCHKESIIITVVGIGGQGKTTVAIAFIKQLQSLNTNVLITWFNGSSLESLTQSVMEVAKELNCLPKGDFPDVIATLNKIGSMATKRQSCDSITWAVVLDNLDTVDNRMLNVLRCFMGMRAFVLVTSRRADAVPLECEVVRLGPLDRGAARSLVVAYLNPVTDSDVELICDKLDCYALGLRHAAAHIKYKRHVSSMEGKAYSASQYFVDLEKKTLSKVPVLLEYSGTTEAIIRMTMSELESAKCGETAIFLLRIFSLIHSKKVQVNYLEQLAVHCDTDCSLQNATCALELLRTFALIDAENRLASIHGIVQMVVKTLMKDDSDHESLIVRVLSTYQLDIHYTRDTVPHFVGIYEGSYSYKHLVESHDELPRKLRSSLREHSLYAELLRFTTSWALALNDLFGPLHKTTLIAEMYKNVSLHRCGRREEALIGMEACYQNHLNSPDYGPFSRETYICLKEVGSAYRKLGNVGRSKEALTEALEKLIEIAGLDNVYTWKTRESLALTLIDVGQYEDALKHLKLVLETRAKKYGPTDRLCLGTRTHMACVLVRQGKFKEAKDELTAIIESRGVEEAEHGSQIYAKQLLAQCLQGLGQALQASFLFTEVLEAYTRLHGDLHPATVEATKFLKACEETIKRPKLENVRY